MPLPAALQARLHKRGLIKEDEIANTKENTQPSKICPNAWNPYHTCVKYCEERYGIGQQGQKSASEKINPLPPGWFLVPDPEKGHRSYYWNVNTNMVSWLHPQDPKAEITQPAGAQKTQDNREAMSGNSDENKKEARENMQNETKFKEPAKTQPKIKTGKHPSLIKGQREKERSNPYQKKQAKRDELDPMDPAAYSDVPRGTWSSGLREDSDVKTGVDTTANGPLFQQRPYPSPGEVLRRNMQQPKS